MYFCLFIHFLLQSIELIDKVLFSLSSIKSSKAVTDKPLRLCPGLLCSPMVWSRCWFTGHCAKVKHVDTVTQCKKASPQHSVHSIVSTILCPKSFRIQDSSLSPRDSFEILGSSGTSIVLSFVDRLAFRTYPLWAFGLRAG